MLQRSNVCWLLTLRVLFEFHPTLQPPVQFSKYNTSASVSFQSSCVRFKQGGNLMASCVHRGQQCANLARRRTVSSWIEAVTGVPIPTSSDYSFRSALRDGVLLCRLINHLKPDSVPQVWGMVFSWTPVCGLGSIVSFRRRSRGRGSELSESRELP